MKPECDVRICDLCHDFYGDTRKNPDYKILYLGNELDICHNCYDSIGRIINKCKNKLGYKIDRYAELEDKDNE